MSVENYSLRQRKLKVVARKKEMFKQHGQGKMEDGLISQKVLILMLMKRVKNTGSTNNKEEYNRNKIQNFHFILQL
jgi:hypothetical protein